MGSHAGKQLEQSYCSVTALDNLSSGQPDAVLFDGCIQGDLADTVLLAQRLHPGAKAFQPEQSPTPPWPINNGAGRSSWAT